MGELRLDERRNTALVGRSGPQRTLSTPAVLTSLPSLSANALRLSSHPEAASPCPSDTNSKKRGSPNPARFSPARLGESAGLHNLTAKDVPPRRIHRLQGWSRATLLFWTKNSGRCRKPHIIASRNSRDGEDMLEPWTIEEGPETWFPDAFDRSRTSGGYFLGEQKVYPPPEQWALI